MLLLRLINFFIANMSTSYFEATPTQLGEFPSTIQEQWPTICLTIFLKNDPVSQMHKRCENPNNNLKIPKVLRKLIDKHFWGSTEVYSDFISKHLSTTEASSKQLARNNGNFKEGSVTGSDHMSQAP